MLPGLFLCGFVAHIFFDSPGPWVTLIRFDACVTDIDVFIDALFTMAHYDTGTHKIVTLLGTGTLMTDTRRESGIHAQAWVLLGLGTCFPNWGPPSEVLLSGGPHPISPFSFAKKCNFPGPPWPGPLPPGPLTPGGFKIPFSFFRMRVLRFPNFFPPPFLFPRGVQGYRILGNPRAFRKGLECPLFFPLFWPARGAIIKNTPILYKLLWPPRKKYLLSPPYLSPPPPRLAARIREKNCCVPNRVCVVWERK